MRRDKVIQTDLHCQNFYGRYVWKTII